MHNMRILGATLTPFEDTFKGSPLEGYYNSAKEQKRLAVNKWIRESGAFDGVLDFDAVVRDPVVRPTSKPSTMPGIISIPTMRATRQWQSPSICSS